LQAIDLWYKSQNREDDDESDEASAIDRIIGAKKWKKKWRMRDVVGGLNRQEIIEKSGHAPGSIQFLAEYKNTVSKVMERLPNDTAKEYMALARSWNKSGAPREVQMRYVTSHCLKYVQPCNPFTRAASKHAGKSITQFVDHMDKCYGAKVLVFAAFVNKSDDLCIAGYVNYCSFAIQYLIHICELEWRKIINHNSLFNTNIPSSTRRPFMIFMPGLQQKVNLVLCIIDYY
jgi:hypothetical protein